MKRNLLLTVLAVAVPTLTVPAVFHPAAAQIDVRIDFAPPAPRPEVVPAPRPGYVWAPGHWAWDGRQHVWREGHWEMARAGYRFVPERWERVADNGREGWRFLPSRWDRDGDGIPNRYDAVDNRLPASPFNIMLDFAPPAPRYEVIPAPRAGYVWAPGHWLWDGRQHVWIAGRWEQARVGYRYIPERWERFTDGGRERWRFVASRWDRDGNGVPDRLEGKAPNHNGGPNGDKDHDGIPNKYDRYDNRR